MPLDDSALARLGRSVSGEVLAPADAGFAAARTGAIRNGAIPRQPEWDPGNVFRHNANIPPAGSGIPSPRPAASVRADDPVR
jgi:hypothetical protein